MRTSSDTNQAAGKQLQDELRLASLDVVDAEILRPVLHHLNADSSWLLSLPYPSRKQPPFGRRRFNILLDVWLHGPQVDFFTWFSSQEHATPSSVQSMKEVNELLKRIENPVDSPAHGGQDVETAPVCFIDAVFCSHEFTDHCHEPTLRELPTHIPIFGPSKAASLVRSWKHFENVFEVPILKSGFDWHQTTPSSFPDWIGVGRIHSRGDAPSYLHSALIIIFSLSDSQEAEAIVYTPHGVAAQSLEIIKTGKPLIQPLVLLHGLHKVSLLGSRLNLGMKNALEIQEFLKAPYWLRTHDEEKIAKGIVASFLTRSEHTLPLAQGGHPITTNSTVDDPSEKISDKSFVEVGNGQSLVLR